MANLTVESLIETLKKFPKDAIVLVYREGKGHSFMINENDVQIEKNPYFPSDSPEDEGYEWDDDKQCYTKDGKEVTCVTIGIV